jgi:tRNA U34 5-methylaminomethyl-2-thiouridine-forming methyltransferase MnmC
MVPPHRPQTPTEIPGLEWIVTDDGSRTLWSAQASETFHSGCGAVAESLVVYLLNSGVAKRLVAQQPTHVLEVGLGTGTDFLLSAALADRFLAPLEYTALESSLLSCSVLHHLHENVLWHSAHDYCIQHGLPELADAFSVAEPILERFCQAMQAAQDQSSHANREGHQSQHRLSDWINLRIIHGDATCFEASHYELEGRNDAVFFDPFSPESAPELWTDAMFRRVSMALRFGGSLTTYCVKGTVRRQLAALGFAVAKMPGPAGGKREVLHATKQA